MIAKLGKTIAIRMFPAILLPQKFQCHMGLTALAHLLLEVGQQRLEFLETLVRIGCIASLQTMFQHRVIQFQKPVDTERISQGFPHVVVHCLLIHAYLSGCFAVGDVLLFQ